jgi:hypothetical protein
MKKFLLFLILSTLSFSSGSSDISISSSTTEKFGEKSKNISYQNINFYTGNNFTLFSNCDFSDTNKQPHSYNAALTYADKTSLFFATVGLDKHGEDYLISKSSYVVLGSSSSFLGVNFTPEIITIKKELYDSSDKDIRFKYNLEKEVIPSFKLFNSGEFSIDTDSGSSSKDYSIGELGAAFNKITPISFINIDIALGKNKIESRDMNDMFIRSDFSSKHYLKQNIALKIENCFNSEFDKDGAFSNKTSLRGEYLINYAGKDANKCYLYTSLNKKGDFEIIRHSLGGDYWILEPVKTSLDIFKKSSEINESKGVNLSLSCFLNDTSSIYILYENETFNKNIYGIESANSIALGTNINF